MSVRIAFFGSGSPISTAALRALAERFTVVAVVVPGARRPRGPREALRALARRRGRQPLQRLAEEKSLPVLRHRPGRDEELVAGLALHDPDLVCVATYPYLLKAPLLTVGRRGAIGLHPALLPRHRGPDPLFWTYFHDDAEAGVTAFWLDEGEDTGDVIVQEAIPLPRGLPRAELYSEVARRGAALLARAVEQVEDGSARRTPQDVRLATREPAPVPGSWRIDDATWSAERRWHFQRGAGPRHESAAAQRVARAARRAAPALLVASFLFLAFWSVRGQDATHDERHYFGQGRALLTTGRWMGPALLHPPLSFYVNSLPLLFMVPPAEAGGPVLLWCRMVSLAVFAIPLLLVVMWWARELYGPDAGLLALALAAFSPTLLAHAPLITPDLALTSTGFVTLYLFWRSRWGERRTAGWAIALGLTLLTKGSAWLVVASIVAPTLVALRSGGARRLGNVAAGLALAWLVLNLGYGFAGLLDGQGKQELLAKVPDLPLARPLAALASPLFPLPYLRSMTIQLAVASRGVPAFLMGEISSEGWRHYFLVALLIKETLPFLVLLAAGGVTLRWTRARWLDEATLMVPAALFVLAFSLGKVQIGIRYLLPALPFLFVFAAKVTKVTSLIEGGGRAARLLLAGLLAWHVGSAIAICPDFIAYFNELVGGPRQGYRYLGDSNLDWGQNRTRARTWSATHGVVFEPEALPERGRVMVRAHRLQGLADAERYRVLREEYTPVGHVGYNWLVYDLERKK